MRNGIRQRYPNIKFILSHAGGFVPYASYRLAMGIAADTGRNPLESLDEFSSFYFDTALSSSAAALPTLLAFAKPGHITFGSDFPFGPVEVGKFFAGELENYPGLDADTRAAIDRDQRADRCSEDSAPDLGRRVDLVGRRDQVELPPVDVAPRSLLPADPLIATHRPETESPV